MEAYSTLRLSPFAGINLVVQVEDARAVSRDGVQWELQLRRQVPRQTGWGSLRGSGDVTRYVMFGVWSAAHGLASIPANLALPEIDQRAQAEPLIDALQAATPPFPRRDHYELWLLHGRSELPLALLYTSLDTETRPVVRSPAWVGADSGDLSFDSAVPAKYPAYYRASPGMPLYPIKALEEAVKRAAYPASAQWFVRDAEGNGEGLDGPHLDPHLPGRRLPAAAFPELLLHNEWPVPEVTELVADFLRWRAPWLLMLPELSAARRAELEVLAAQQALLVSRFYRAYPRICDPARLQAVLVEARLREAASN